MVDSFVPYVVDAATHTTATVVPVKPPGSADGRVRVVATEKGQPLHIQQNEARREGALLVLGPDHPPAKAAFIHQE